MKELYCILVSYFMIRQNMKYRWIIHYFHKNDNINSYLNPHPPSWDVRNDHIDASDITLLHNYGFEIRLNIKTGINAYVCFRMKTVMKSPYSLHSKTIKRLPLGCILPWHLLGHAIKSITCFDLQFSRSTRPMTSFCIFIAYINTEGILFNVKITRWD